jgi:enamine deaminase RidA (YjgF/YER057c/UK114 family)
MRGRRAPTADGKEMGFDAALAELGLALPDPLTPAGRYVNAVRAGTILILGGHVPIDPEGEIVVSKVGLDLDVDAARDAARLAALSALATLRAELGSLDGVSRILSMRGVVNATEDFTAHTQVIDATSEVFEQVFGPAGRHARLAVGVSSLPANLALEIELLVEIADRVSQQATAP